MIAFQILILLIGFIALIKGADLFVEGSAALAKNFKVPGLIIGLTIVALGTSAPELAVSTSAALQGSNEIALSNVVGSNIFNLLCVLGVCAVIHPVPVDDKILKRDFPVSLLATVFVLFGTCGSCMISGDFFSMGMEENVGLVTRILGIVLLICFISYIIYLIADAKKHPVPEDETSVRTIRACLLFIFVGLVLIVGGGRAVVNSAKEIAKAAGMTETLIGLTIVAVGTSLPELVTSIVAARKGETGLAVGNVVGSNIFNLLFILGISAAIHPVSVNLASVYDLGILILVSILTWLFSVSDHSIKRIEGAIMLVVYVADVVFAIMR